MIPKSGYRFSDKIMPNKSGRKSARRSGRRAQVQASEGTRRPGAGGRGGGSAFPKSIVAGVDGSAGCPRRRHDRGRRERLLRKPCLVTAAVYAEVMRAV